jgi:hypothetical protein
MPTTLRLQSGIRNATLLELGEEEYIEVIGMRQLHGYEVWVVEEGMPLHSWTNGNGLPGESDFLDTGERVIRNRTRGIDMEEVKDEVVEDETYHSRADMTGSLGEGDITYGSTREFLPDYWSDSRTVGLKTGIGKSYGKGRPGPGWWWVMVMAVLVILSSMTFGIGWNRASQSKLDTGPEQMLDFMKLALGTKNMSDIFNNQMASHRTTAKQMDLFSGGFSRGLDNPKSAMVDSVDMAGDLVSNKVFTRIAVGVEDHPES